MKLYDVPCGSTIRVISDIGVPIAAPDIKAGEVIRFHHIDGMYSFCHNMKGQVVHLVAWAEVEVVNDEFINLDDKADEVDEAERDCN